jgi:hypothetical protein
MPVITQAQYTKILLANLRQLWTDYGEPVTCTNFCRFRVNFR